MHGLIARALGDVISGKTKRLMIFAPPQHGKSELVSVRLPALWLARRPDDPVILSSYAASLAYTKSYQARGVVESDEFAVMFPSVRTDQASRAKDHWNLSRPYRGSMLASGVGGPVTGHGAMLGIIDDPFENWEQAQSATIRERVWDWWRGTFRTRIWEHGAVVLIMCMTGDTPVLMADGTERPLSEIKVGEQVATFENGRLATSTVRNHKSNGLDTVFEIKTICGKIVYANERHPFLVEEHGQLKWIRLKDLTTAHKIVILKDKRGNGKEKPASLTVAKNPSARGAIARRITTKKCGPMVIALRRLMLRRAAVLDLSTATGLQAQNTIQCLKSRAANAPSVDKSQAITYALTGAVNSASTIATKPTPSGAFCVTTVTLPWATPRQKKLRLPLSNTSDFTTEAIESIEPAGVKEVFDIQVERTENFIASGLVSHNTRWHQDDLAGRLLLDQPGEWTVLRLPAIAETQEDRDQAARRIGLPVGAPDPLGRLPGEPLAPTRFSLAALEALRRDVGSMVWAAEYQGNPAAAEGNRFRRHWFKIIDVAPTEIVQWFRYWDKAASINGKRTAGVKIGKARDGRIIIAHTVAGQWTTLERRQVMLQTAQMDGKDTHVVIEQEPGSSGVDSVQDEIRMLVGFPVFADRPSGDKDTRLEPFAAQAEAGNVFLVRGEWNEAYIDEMLAVPNGAFRDRADATAGGFNRLAKRSIASMESYL